MKVKAEEVRGGTNEEEVEEKVDPTKNKIEVVIDKEETELKAEEVKGGTDKEDAKDKKPKTKKESNNKNETSGAKVDICKLEKDKGGCRALIPKFYFDHKAKECKEFNYFGCKGNGNRFSSKEECKAACMDGGIFYLFL